MGNIEFSLGPNDASIPLETGAPRGKDTSAIPDAVQKLEAEKGVAREAIKSDLLLLDNEVVDSERQVPSATQTWTNFKKIMQRILARVNEFNNQYYPGRDALEGRIPPTDVGATITFNGQSVFIGFIEWPNGQIAVLPAANLLVEIVKPD